MNMDELQWRRIIVSASGLIYWGGVIIQARRIRKKIGRSPNLKPRTRREKLLWLGWFLVILVWISQPFFARAAGAQNGLTLFPFLSQPATFLFGLVLIVLGYAGTLWTYAVMGAAWRMGVNAAEKNELVDRGPFGSVRHPIYSLQIVMLVGAALLLPTPVSFLNLTLQYICVQLKAADEENYLLTVHGDNYRAYRRRTGKLLPRLWPRRYEP
jgi:protein-S-isoprenylcysteine O-methyltransferase Ste14